MSSSLSLSEVGEGTHFRIQRGADHTGLNQMSKPYTKPEIICELELEVRAGTPLNMPRKILPLLLEPERSIGN